MKTIVKIMLFMAFLPFACAEISAQQTHNPNLTPYNQFAPDSMAYLWKNFVYGSMDFYQDRPLKDLFDDLVIAVKGVEVLDNDEISVLTLSMLSQEDELESDIHARLFVKLRTSIKPEDELYQKLIRGDGKVTSFNRIEYSQVVDDELRKLIEPLLVKEAHLLWLGD